MSGQEKSIFELNGSAFFEKLESLLGSTIPSSIKQILILCDCDTVVVLKDVNDERIEKIQNYVRNVFNATMLTPQEKMEDFVGRYVGCQEAFEFNVGQRQWIDLMKQKCEYLAENRFNSSRIVQDQKSAEQKQLFNLIGSQILTIYNDAKRITLSAWSWPSRIVADQLSANFKKRGSNYRDVEPQIDLLYVNPTHHNELLESIVRVDIEQLQRRLRNSLAMSLRVDGSVDRTQQHNIHVLIHVVHEDANLSTYFLGFDIPDGSKADSYFAVTKKIVNKILPWDELIGMIISIVTDGEELNKGHLTGLWTKLLDAKQMSSTATMPLIRTWCVGHRTNFAWKNTSSLDIIRELIADASQISTHFHNSGERTRKLAAAASTENLDIPLRYPQVFEVRWTEFTYSLLKAVLRNWRASVAYFKSEKLEAFSNRWLCYDKVHLTTFLCDVLLLVKSFHKQFQSNSTSIAEIPAKKTRLLQRLNDLQTQPLENGWEVLFLQEIVQENEKTSLYGHELNETSGRTRTASSSPKFATNDRLKIIKTLITNLNERFDYDREIQELSTPLLKIDQDIDPDLLQLSHSCVIPDLDVNAFVSEYLSASTMFSEDERNNPLQTIVKFEQSSSHRFPTLKIALARTAVIKPHSADVERMITVYNKYKDTDRTLISAATLFNNIYIYSNMCTLSEYDPTPAIEHWMSIKNRKPRYGAKSKQQEWFKGVFPEAKHDLRSLSEVIKF